MTLWFLNQTQKNQHPKKNEDHVVELWSNIFGVISKDRSNYTFFPIDDKRKPSLENQHILHYLRSEYKI